MKVENTTKASGRLKKRPKTSKANSKEEKSVEVAQKDLERAKTEENKKLALKQLGRFRGEEGAFPEHLKQTAGPLATQQAQTHAQLNAQPSLTHTKLAQHTHNTCTHKHTHKHTHTHTDTHTHTNTPHTHTFQHREVQTEIKKPEALVGSI